MARAVVLRTGVDFLAAVEAGRFLAVVAGLTVFLVAAFVLATVLRALVDFLAATRFVAVLAADFTVLFGAVLVLPAVFLVDDVAAFFGAARLTEACAAVFLAAGLARAGAFFLEVTVDLIGVFAFAVVFLGFAAAFGFALLAVVFLGLPALVEDDAAFLFGALPVQGGVAPFNFDVA